MWPSWIYSAHHIPLVRKKVVCEQLSMSPWWKWQVKKKLPNHIIHPKWSRSLQQGYGSEIAIPKTTIRSCAKMMRKCACYINKTMFQGDNCCFWHWRSQRLEPNSQLWRKATLYNWTYSNKTTTCWRSMRNVGIWSASYQGRYFLPTFSEGLMRRRQCKFSPKPNPSSGFEFVRHLADRVDESGGK